MAEDIKIEHYHLNKFKPSKLQFELYSLGDYRKRSSDKAAIPHAHSYYQIIWFFNAGGTHDIDFKTYEIKENTIVFVTKNQVHAFDDNLDIDGWLIHFNESFFMHSDLDLLLKHNVFNRGKNPVYAIDFKTAIGFSNYLGIIQEELKYREKFGYADVIRFLLKSLLITLERSHLDTNKTLEINDHHQLLYLQFMAIIDENFNKHLTIQEYANQLNISSKTLTTITKSKTGKTPAQLLNDRVILEAKRLLRFTSIQVNEVAYKVGIYDPSYFVKYFKRAVGISPLRFRESKK